MKKNLLSSILCAMLLVSCSSDDTTPTKETVKPLFTAKTELIGGTRTSVDINRNILWSANDRIAIFQKSSISDMYELKSGAGTQNGSFSYVQKPQGQNPDFSAGTELQHNAAVYPYKENYVMSNIKGGYKFENIVFNNQQSFAENTMDDEMLPMIAVSAGTNLKFKNIGGLLKLQFTSSYDVSVGQIDVKGADNEIIAGTATVTMAVDGTEPVMTMDGTQPSYQVNLKCKQPQKLDAATPKVFYIAMPAVEFNKGMIINVRDENNNVINTLKTKKCAIKRNDILVMPALQLNGEGVIGDINPGTVMPV